MYGGGESWRRRLAVIWLANAKANMALKSANTCENTWRRKLVMKAENISWRQLAASRRRRKAQLNNGGEETVHQLSASVNSEKKHKAR
jgi:hypothetical protein